MKRLIWIVLVLAACGKKPEGAANQEGDAAKGEPKVPPPAPTVRPSDKGDCKPDYAPRPKRDPNPMCKIAGGTFVMGEAGATEPGASKTVTLSPYFMDEFEVSNAQVLHYLRATGADDSCTKGIAGMQQSCFLVANSSLIQKQTDGSYALKAGTEHLPFDSASREGAMQYCAWAGKVLPSEPQWEFAARHDPATQHDNIYPWGDAFDASRTNCIEDGCSNAPGDVGTYDGRNGHGDGRSPWGLYEMAGNVREVVADCFAPYTACQGACVDPAPVTVAPGELCHITRGGGIENANQMRSNHRNQYLSYGGFRCARRAP